MRLKPSGQNRRKSSLQESIFYNTALSAELTKNALFQTVFLAILPTGRDLVRKSVPRRNVIA